MNSNNKNITILSVSYNSGEHLGRLFMNLLDKAVNKECLKFLVVDNTGGKDKKLYDYFNNELDLEFYSNDCQSSQRSISHASALDLGLKKSNTVYTLILDPDIHIFKYGWDQFCIDLIQSEEKVVIGAPYPFWKLGKVHDYPSVVFMFFQTRQVQSFNKSFAPFPHLLNRVANSILRKITRLGIIANKRRLDKSKTLRLITTFLENLFGITSPDTGKKIVDSFKEHNFKSINFEAVYSRDLKKNIKVKLSHLAEEFELYLYNNKPFITHMYGSGVFHWKTNKGSSKTYWQDLIAEIEKEEDESFK